MNPKFKMVRYTNENGDLVAQLVTTPQYKAKRKMKNRQHKSARRANRSK